MVDTTIPDLIYSLAEAIRKKMVETGLNPMEPADVSSYVNGCKVSSQLKRLILEEIEQE